MDNEDPAKKTPAQLVRQLRRQLGRNGKELTQSELAALIGAPDYQRINAWENGRSAISEKYAEALAKVSQDTVEPHEAEDYLENGDALEPRLRAIEEALRELPARVEAEISRASGGSHLQEMEQRVADQLRAQSALLKELAAATAEMRAAARDLQAAARPRAQKPA